MKAADQHQEILDEIVEEFTQRLRRGERPAINDFSVRHPDLRFEIEELLTSVAMIEELKTQSNTNADSLKLQLREILKLDRIGDYRIVRELGRGGMGIVFEAVHESLGRQVAIKVMPNRTFDDEKYLERFKREAQAAANLHHTNIVSVFGMGRAGEHHYYVMEFVDGESLSCILTRIVARNDGNTQPLKGAETVPQDRKLNGLAKGSNRLLGKPPQPLANRNFLGSPAQRYRWAAQTGLQIADGLAYAHGLGTLHRDIKPSNLLIDRNETVWLTDFGLVKNLNSQSITKSGDIIGTPQYMAPESFEGKYDERSETYCLGLTLYEMVTLRPAYENVSTPELIRRITTTSPVAPRKIDRGIPRDLSRIIQKSISREPADRYRNASEMRDDLLAFLDDRPISARTISMTENVWRWSRRNPLSASLAIATGLLICLVAITATIALSISNRALVESEEQKTSLQVEKRVASYARDRAEANIDFTVGLFDRMFTSLVLKGQSSGKDFSLEGFNQLSGIQTTVNEADAEFLDQMLRFYMDFAEQNKDNMTLRTLAAKSFRRVANIYHLTGEFEKADDAYRKSIAIYEDLQKKSPRSPDPILDLARTLNEKGLALEVIGTANSWQRAVEEYSKAAELLRGHLQYGRMELQLELANTLVLIGSAPMWQKPELPERFSEIADRQPNSPFATRSDNRRPAANPIRTYRPGRSKQLIEEAMEIADSLIEKSPDRVDLQLLKATALTRQAELQATTQKQRESRNLLDQAVRLIEKLQVADPENPEYKFVLAQILATPVRSTTSNAIDSLNQSKSILTALAAKYDRNFEYQQSLASVCFRLGRMYETKGEWENAERNLKFASSLYQDILRETPRSRQVQLSGCSCLLQLVDLQIRNEKFESAVVSLESAIQNSDEMRLAKGRMPNSFFLMKATLYQALSVIHRDAGNQESAAEAKAKARVTMRGARLAGSNAENRIEYLPSSRSPN